MTNSLYSAFIISENGKNSPIKINIKDYKDDESPYNSYSNLVKLTWSNINLFIRQIDAYSKLFYSLSYFKYLNSSKS